MRRWALEAALAVAAAVMGGLYGLVLAVGVIALGWVPEPLGGPVVAAGAMAGAGFGVGMTLGMTLAAAEVRRAVHTMERGAGCA